MYLHEPSEATNRSLYAEFQHSPVISNALNFEYENFHSGNSVPSVSRNSSDGSSQSLKSIKIRLEFYASDIESGNFIKISPFTTLFGMKKNLPSAIS